MKIKIGDKWYAPEKGQPVMIVLSEQDKANIKGMHPNATKYALASDDEFENPSLFLEWMDDEESDEPVPNTIDPRLQPE